MNFLKKNKAGFYLLLLSLPAVVAAIMSFTATERPGKSTPPPAAKKQPNVVVVLVDQWRGQALGFLHKEKVRTPNLDTLARGGLALTQMVSNFPLCSPARAMLMTGNYPIKTKVYTNVNSLSAPYGIELPASTTCWSDILKSKGYSNGYIGKWHLDSPHEPYIPTSNNTAAVAWNEWTPPGKRHGFDYWYAYGTYDEHNRPMYWDTHAGRDEFHYVNQWGPEHEVDKALDFLDNRNNVRKSGAPFCLMLSVNPPHSGYKSVPQKYYAMYAQTPVDSLLSDPNIPPANTPMGKEYRDNIKYYYACMTGVDAQVGRLVQGLKDRNMLDNTIILFTSDHGNCLGKHGEISKNNIYEESLSIPFIIYWKGKILPRTDHRFLGSMPDIFPTLLDLTGNGSAIPKDIDGKSYAAYFLNGSGPHPSEQFIMGNIGSNNPRIDAGFRGIRTNRYKLAYERKKDSIAGYLFDLEKDPFELTNLYAAGHAEVKRLYPVLEQWLKKTGDGFRPGR